MLGFQEREPETITLEEIKKAIAEKKAKIKEAESNLIRQIEFFIGDSVGKETYDAFLSDYQMIKNKNLNIDAEILEQETIEFLNTKTKLSRLELSKEQERQLRSELEMLQKSKEKIKDLSIGIPKAIPEITQRITTILEKKQA